VTTESQNLEYKREWKDEYLKVLCAFANTQGGKLLIEIEMIATATATGIKAVAEAIAKKGGDDAVDLQITQGYLESFGKILTSSKTTVLPSNMANIVGAFEGLSKVTGSFPGGKSGLEGKGDKK
jgi:regulator of protease activity HflC (stomatin/prohibitin superfamily)